VDFFFAVWTGKENSTVQKRMKNGEQFSKFTVFNGQKSFYARSYRFPLIMRRGSMFKND